MSSVSSSSNSLASSFGVGTINVGGLASGLNTSQLITELLQVDSAPLTQMQWQQDLWNSRKSVWQQLSTNLSSLDTAAQTLQSATTWHISTGVTSNNSSQVSGTEISGQTPASGTYSVAVSQLASADTWTAATALPGATSGVRTTGEWYSGSAGTAATGASKLTSLKNASGTGLGVNNGSTITMTTVVGGVQHVNSFDVTSTSTLADLQSWAQSQIPGSTVSLAGGQLSITTQPGTANELTQLSFTATNAAGAALTKFNGSSGATSATTTAASDGGAAASDTLTISQGASQWYVNIAAGDNEAAIASKINAATGGAVQASVQSGKLQLKANATGASSDFTVTSSGSLVSQLGLAESSAGQDAQFTVNGTAYTSSTNSSTTAIQGVDLSLSALTGGTPVTLTVDGSGATTDSIISSITDFVNAYNSSIDYINTQTSATTSTNPQTESDYLQGPLAQNYDMESVAYNLESTEGGILSSNPVGYQTLADIGISTGAITGSYDPNSITGKLTIDTDKLTQALNTNPSAVQALLTQLGTGPNQGIVSQIQSAAELQVTSGTVEASIQGAGDQVSSLQTSIDSMNNYLTQQKAYYQQMFDNLETTLSGIEAQASGLSALSGSSSSSSSSGSSSSSSSSSS